MDFYILFNVKLNDISRRITKGRYNNHASKSKLKYKINKPFNLRQ
jgi:hypothetical protein